METVMPEVFSVSNITVNLKDGTQYVGLSGKLFANAAGDPKLLQIRKTDRYVTVPWEDVRDYVNV